MEVLNRVWPVNVCQYIFQHKMDKIASLNKSINIQYFITKEESSSSQSARDDTSCKYHKPL